LKENGCEKTEDKGKNLAGQARIYRFEGENGVTRVWMVLVLLKKN
jgi:hypothetical protein